MTRSIFLAGGLLVVDELNGEVEIGTLDQSDDVLQGVTVCGDAKLALVFEFSLLGSIVSNQFAQLLSFSEEMPDVNVPLILYSLPEERGSP